jgi:hypothetical protein
MKKIADVVKQNPQAAERLEARKEMLTSLQKLRAAGIAKGPPTIMSPQGGRYNFDSLPRPTRFSKPAIKESK